MDIQEINEISDSFLEAWIEYFGAPMHLVAFDEVASSQDGNFDSLYDEAEELKYDFGNKVKFHGTLKDLESLDEETALGERENTELSIVFITKELRDAGIPKVDSRSIIEFADPDGGVHHYKIVDIVPRVQFMQYRIFTKLKVVELSDFKRGVI